MKKQFLAMILSAVMMFSGAGTALATDGEAYVLTENSDLEEIYTSDAISSGSETQSNIVDENSSEPLGEGITISLEDAPGALSEEAEKDSLADAPDESPLTEDTEANTLLEDAATEDSLLEEDALSDASDDGAYEQDTLLEDAEEDTRTFSTGLSLDGITTSIIRGDTADDAAFLATYPSSYRTADLPPLRDQNPYGTCWSFASLALAEISLMKKGIYTEPDLSELHLAYFTFNSVVDPLGGTEGDYISYGNNVLNYGGNFEMAFQTLAKWTGAASETTVPYKQADKLRTSGLSASLAYNDYAHLKSAYIAEIDMDSFRSSKDISALAPIKQMVTDYGAAGMCFGAIDNMSSAVSTNVYSKKHKSYYNSTPIDANHAVVIVGWDDDFSGNNFAKKAPGDGAFLIRNSWTTTGSPDNLDYAGYFWMSYYEPSIIDTFYALEAAPADDYDNNYQYDGNNAGAFTKVAKGANVFTAHSGSGDETLRAVTFYSLADSTSYTVEIYRGVSDTPASGTLVSSATTTGVTPFAGYINVPLASPVPLTQGHKFAVVVTLGSDSLMADASYKQGGYLCASASDGESYYAVGSHWYPLPDNFRIKAFTNNSSAKNSAEEAHNIDDPNNSDKETSDKETSDQNSSDTEESGENDIEDAAIDWGDITDESVREQFDNNPANIPQTTWYVIDSDVVRPSDSSHLSYSADYTGSKITFDRDIAVYSGTARLTQGKDYTISYSQNIKASAPAGTTPSFTVKTKGQNKNSRTFYFTIDQVPISRAVVTTETVIPVSKGSKKLSSIKPKLTYGSKTLKLGTDYHLEYQGLQGIIDDPSKVILNDLDANYTISIVAYDEGNFMGTHEQTISVLIVNPKEIIPASKFTVGDSNRKALKFSYCDISYDTTPMDFFTSGRAFVYYNKEPLEPGTDYDVLEVEDNYSTVGTHRIRIVGLGGERGFTGSKTVTFKVLPYNIKNDSDSRLEIKVPAAQYNKKGSTPPVTVTFLGPDGEKTELTQGVDYTLSYKNNKKVAAAGTSKSPTVIIKGKGRFSGTATKQFSIYE